MILAAASQHGCLHCGILKQIQKRTCPVLLFAVYRRLVDLAFRQADWLLKVRQAGYVRPSLPPTNGRYAIRSRQGRGAPPSHAALGARQHPLRPLA